APVPVLVIGNITVGGSGKTPLLIELVNYLKQHNVKVGVLSRGYGGSGPFPMLVTSASQAAEAGWENTAKAIEGKVELKQVEN
ncbi:tetraacyldisaccharide 4'-kinase, partial [Escherichia sp. R-CC3]